MSNKEPTMPEPTQAEIQYEVYQLVRTQMQILERVANEEPEKLIALGYANVVEALRDK